jgi:hypothetical protein
VQLLDEARAAGVELRWWSPWNEPNHPFFIASQRAECSGRAKSLATEPYAQLARAMRRALEGYPGRQEMVIGETAGLLDRKPTYTDVRGFIRGLPKDVVCSARAYGQHGYIGGPDPVDDVARALRPFDCKRNLEIWMTETGAGRARSGEERDTSRKGQLRNCRAMHRRLKRWYEDPRVTAAFQYTLREDDRFPTGLVTTDLTKAYPALKEWQAWGDREPAAAPPKAHCS